MEKPARYITPNVPTSDSGTTTLGIIVAAMLRSFSQDDRDHMVEDGKISVTCEFCSANYQFAPGDVGANSS